MSNNPFRFGIQLPQLDATRRPDEVRRIEALGFSSVLVPDHFTSSLWDPTTLLASAAAVTETLKVGSLVYDVDYRHPVIYARQAAT
ncbi:MAG: LLM class flavin-dependent oxidoreductase, partial [Gammaproteobacteria bacterium]